MRPPWATSLRAMAWEDSPIVQLKYRLLDAATPAADALVFGDVWGVDGAYTARCRALGCERVTVVDTLETSAFVRRRLADPAIDFVKADFSDPFAMATISDRCEIGVIFDVLLHQPPLLAALHGMADKVTGRIVLAQPCRREQTDANTLVYLPGNTNKALHPYPTDTDDYRVFDPTEVNHSHWIWAMTPSFVRSALLGEGFEVVAEDSVEEGHGLSGDWFWWGCVARRTGPTPPRHWTQLPRTFGIYDDPTVTGRAED